MSRGLFVLLVSAWPCVSLVFHTPSTRPTWIPRDVLLSTGRPGNLKPLWAEPVTSPFAANQGDEDGPEYDDEDDVDLPGSDMESGSGPFPLTLENVEMVLDEMRPYLISDGGNVAVREIDGPVVRLELQGACGSCPSSTMTMKMGLERRLKEAIPEISEVVQALPDTPDLTVEEVDTVLDGIRPFLSVAGGKIEVAEITGEGSIQPRLLLRMEGASSTIQSVKLEIMQRIQRHFMISGLRIDWE